MMKLKYQKKVSKYTHFITWKNVVNLILRKVQILRTQMEIAVQSHPKFNKNSLLN